jgi:DNA-binding cell septation regulator SpoVG
MEIKLIKLRPLTGYGRLKALADIQYGNVILTGIRLLEQNDELFIGMPAKKHDETWNDIFYFNDHVERDRVRDIIIAEYNKLTRKESEEMILNLTQHPATEDQKAEGVIDFAGEVLEGLKTALTFMEIPDEEEITKRANYITLIASRQNPGAKKAMIGGAPYLMSTLERALRKAGIEPVYAFSLRVSKEEPQPDGSVLKVQKLEHEGFISPPDPFADETPKQILEGAMKRLRWEQAEGRNS